MKGFLRFSIFAAFVVWLTFCGGWNKLCAGYRQMQHSDSGKSKSTEASGVIDAFHRNDDLSKVIKKEGD